MEDQSIETQSSEERPPTKHGTVTKLDYNSPECIAILKEIGVAMSELVSDMADLNSDATSVYSMATSAASILTTVTSIDDVVTGIDATYKRQRRQE